MLRSSEEGTTSKNYFRYPVREITDKLISTAATIIAPTNINHPKENEVDSL